LLLELASFQLASMTKVVEETIFPLVNESKALCMKFTSTSRLGFEADKFFDSEFKVKKSANSSGFAHSC